MTSDGTAGRKALLTARIAAVLAAASLVLSVTGLTPADAARAVQRALSAKNSDAVDGISASRTPRPRQLLALGANGRFPASVLGGSVRGPRGAQGPEGPQGGPGPAGSAEAITTKLRSATVPAAADTAVDTVQMLLPAGDWFLIGTGNGIWDPAAGSVYFFCQLLAGQSLVDTALTRLGDGPDAVRANRFSLQGTVNVPTTTLVRIRCAHDQGAPGSLRVEQARITAFRVNAVSTQNGDGT